MLKRFNSILMSIIALTVYSKAGYAEPKVLTVGYFPNVTHAQALVAQSMEAEGKSWFGTYLPDTKIRWISFNAGPASMEALFAQTIDMTYVGPSPVLNAFVRSKGGVTVVSGAVRGGAGLIVPKDSSLSSSPADYKGKRIATPQLGNTQDIACRYWFLEAGMRVSISGGDVFIIPTTNPNILTLFATKGIDAAWTVEPWLSRLEEEGGRIVYSEPIETSITTVLAARNSYLKDNPQIVDQFVKAHHDLTQWIIDNPVEAKQRVAKELSRQMRRDVPGSLIERSWSRLVFDTTITVEDFAFSLKAAQSVGFIKGKQSIDTLVRAK